jgi:F-type H+-transporting ATPase subunit a
MTQLTENKLFTKSKMMQKILLVFAFCASFSLFAKANDEVHAEDHQEEEGFNAGEMIMHHIADAHEIHFFTLDAKSEHPRHFSIYLPVILYTENGLKVFGSGNFYHNPIHVEKGHAFQHGDYILSDEVVYHAPNGLEYDEEGAIINKAPLDLSITKTVVGLLLTSILILWIFISVARSYTRRGNQAPKGLQSLMEPLILFVRDEVAIPSIGAKKADKFMPFLLTVFFFIWIANLLGLMSFAGGYNVMGSVSVSLVLAFIVFVITTINGNKHYWKHIVWPDGVPFLIKLILVPIEVVQVFLKPTVLMIRLTANITAGHIIILAFTALIFIFGQQSVVAGYGVGAGSLIFMVFMFVIELLVAFLQAYVFTLLSALYFGAAVEEAHH